MEEGKGVVKRVLIAKFKDGISSEQIDKIIKDFANLVNLIPTMKDFQWGKNMSVENMNEGFTHVFEPSFESVEGLAEYSAHPAHIQFSKEFLANVDKMIVIDCKPTRTVYF